MAWAEFNLKAYARYYESSVFLAVLTHRNMPIAVSWEDALGYDLSEVEDRHLQQILHSIADNQHKVCIFTFSFVLKISANVRTMSSFSITFLNEFIVLGIGSFLHSWIFREISLFNKMNIFYDCFVFGYICKL